MTLAAWWLARGEDSLPATENWLSSGESAYANTRRFTKRRSEFLVARFTAKNAVRQVLDLPATPAALRTIEIRHEPSGAPFVCVEGQPADLQVSLTDRAGWAVCLLSPVTTRIGCDLELVEPRADGFVRDYLTASEQRLVDATQSTDERHLVANMIWSAKESALKVLTTGLRRDTRSVEVSLGPVGAGWHALEIASGTTKFPGWWRRFGTFVLTIAGEQSLDPPTNLDARTPDSGSLDSGSLDSGPLDPRTPGAGTLLEDAEPTHTWLRNPLTGLAN